MSGGLALTARLGDEIHIGKDIVITVVEKVGSAVRVSIDAPRSISISRVSREELERRERAE